MTDTEKALSWILKGGLLATPFLVLIVTRALYFPFITGKNFAFRILIEILAVAWVWAALRFPRFRPRSSAVVWAVLVFLAVMGLATIFSLSPYRSFWSSFERMEGYISLLHLALYFLLLGTVFTSDRSWSVFWHTTVGASVIVSLYALFQLAGKFAIHQGRTRIDATFGNATYFAVYLLFHLFFLIWLALRAERRGWRIAYSAAIVLEAVILYYTATRGAILGLLGGLVLLAVALAVTGRGLMRRLALAALGTAVVLPVLFFLARDTGFVKRSPVLDRFATISLSETTTQSRFTIWSMALRGWRERPILGWGQENFVYVFSKYYEPSLWRQEPWFDRAHNVFLDWLIAGGVLGLGAYFGMYVAAGWVLARAYRRRALNALTASVFGALLAAHFFQNLFVFDNLTSYLLFFAVLAYLHAVAGRPVELAPSLPAVSLSNPSKGAAAQASAARRRALFPRGFPGAMAVIAGVAVLALLYFANAKPILAAKSILDALAAAQFHPAAGRVDAVLTAFRRGLNLHTFGTMELREQTSQVVATIGADPAIAGQDRAKLVELAIGELEAQRRAFPSDVRAKIFLASLYAGSGQAEPAIAVVNEALAISDRRPHFYFAAAEAYLNANRPDQAIAALRRAYELAPDYPEAVANLATVLVVIGREAEAEALLEKHYGTAIVAEERLALAYARRGRLDRALKIWEELVRVSAHSAKYRANLGAILFELGRRREAIAAFEEAARLEPGFRAQADEIIRQIRSGR